MGIKKIKAEEKKEIEAQEEIALAINAWKKSRPDLLERKKKKEKQEGTYIRFPNELRVSLQLLDFS